METEKKVQKMDPQRIESIVSRGGVMVWSASSLKAAGFKKFVQQNFTTLLQYGKQFIVPDFELAKLSEEEAVSVKLLLEKGTIALMECGEAGDFSGCFKALAEKGVNRATMLLNDSAVMSGVIAVAKQNNVFCYFYEISDEGEAEPLTRKFQPNKSGHTASKSGNGETKPADGNHQTKHAGGNRDARSPKGRPFKQNADKFEIKNVPEKIAFAPIAVSEILKEGSLVKDKEGKEYHLVKRELINNGASTYSTGTEGVWIKIFDKASLNTFTEAKIERMLSRKIKHPGLCWPISMIYDDNNVFRGYAMPEVKGVPLHLCIFKRAGIDKYFPEWNKLDLCELTETILKTIEYLHRMNILMGCINPAAICVVNKNEVYFADTDNYQIEGFPSLVHNVSFTAPELLDKKIYLASKQNENFAVAELVFMLMMPGKTPYAIGSDESPVNAIKKMWFPYKTKYVQGNSPLPSMWRFMWTHLSSMRGAFYNTFQKGAKYNAIEERREAHYWLTVLGYYKEELQNPENKESLKIYPKTFKREEGETFVECRFCGVEHPTYYFFEDYFEDYQICNSCINKKSDVSFTCKACNKTYYYTNRTALFHRTKKRDDAEWKDQKYCRDCKRKTNKCPQCGNEKPYFYRTCNDCNAARRVSVGGNGGTSGYNGSRNSGSSNNSKSSGGGFFDWLFKK